MRAANVGQMVPNVRLGKATVDTYDGMRSHEELVAAHNEWRDAQPAVTRCARCDWTFEGTAGDARARFAEHLAAEHPDMAVKKTRRASAREASMVLVAQRAADAAKSNEREETPVDEQGSDAPERVNCKITGCTENAAATKGPYARLCLAHRAEAVARRGKVTRRATVKPPPAARNGKPTGRTKLHVLHDLTAASQRIEALQAELVEREREFALLADEFTKAPL